MRDVNTGRLTSLDETAKQNVERRGREARDERWILKVMHQHNLKTKCIASDMKHGITVNSPEMVLKVRVWCGGLSVIV